MSPVDLTRIPSLVSDLRKVPAFADQPQPDLEWFVSQTEERRVAPGEITVREDTPADRMFVLLEGEIRARRENGPADGPVFSGKAGSVAGVLPFSRMKSFTVTGRAVGPARILDFPSKLFPELFQRMPELSARLVGLLTDRVRDFTRTEQQHEKLAALGKLSAGLAHELNNPAAAARRSAGALRDCLQRLRDAGRTSTLGPEDCGLLARREEEIRAMLKPPEFKDEFARVEREEAIQAWLEAHKVADAWKLAPHLADANFADAHLESFASAAGASLGPEPELIKAIKEYSYMDQAPLQEVDIKHSLETTLTIMNHKLKRGISVTREYAPDLPKVMAYGSELNQVWTNLIDNAADAMKSNGELLVRAVRENEYVLVEIADNGPGIPPEIQSRIFDPFFTTKGVGEGSGLGLDLVHRIVQKMRGFITIKSVPGDTRFRVRIPIHGAL